MCDVRVSNYITLIYIMYDLRQRYAIYRNTKEESKTQNGLNGLQWRHFMTTVAAVTVYRGATVPTSKMKWKWNDWIHARQQPATHNTRVHTAHTHARRFFIISPNRKQCVNRLQFAVFSKLLFHFEFGSREITKENDRRCGAAATYVAAVTWCMK